MLELRICFLFLVVLHTRAQDSCNPPQGRYETCNECLTLSGENCGWCSDRINREVVGCVDKDTPCQQMDFKGAEVIERASKSANIEPSELRIKMRPNIKYRVNVTASKSELPVDMYFLFDLSQTMKAALDDLGNIAQDLAREMAKLTTNRNFGFGIFREKPTPPFDIKRPYKHDFEHHMSLADDIPLFTRKIRETVDIVGNIDNPEAAFDALLQVILCGENIGWRNGSTHIIVLITDATPHTAGDGILGGTWKSFQHSCQLNQLGNKMVYNSLEHDYPSFSAVGYQLKKQETFLIIGTYSYMENYYKKIQAGGALKTSLGIIAKGGGGIETDSLKRLILDTYEDIKDKLILQLGLGQDNLDVRLGFDSISNCGDEHQDGDEIACNKVGVGQKVSFVADIVLSKEACSSSSLSFEIKVFGQENSNLVVSIEPDCECDCMKNSPAGGSNNCNGQGQIRCGVCECQDGFYGDNCECSIELSNSLNELEGIEKCKSPDGLVCSNRGKCSCGKCQCFGLFIGDHCECDQQGCDCGEHGQCNQCVDGQIGCTCDPGWTLDSLGRCDCSTQEDNCKDPFTGTMCNNNGKCKCNRCECERGDGYYCQRPIFEKVTDVDQHSCNELEPCVMLNTFSQILQESDDDDNEILFDLKNKCDKTKLIENARFKCYWTLNQTENIDQFIKEVGERRVIDGPNGTTEKCAGILPKPNLVEMKECASTFKGCGFSFWHDAINGVDGYTSEDYMKKISVYIMYYNKTGNPRTAHNRRVDLDYKVTPVTCPSFIDKWVIIAIVSGIVGFIFITCFVVYFILINLYDRWEYQRFKQDAADAWQIGNVQESMLGQEKRKSKFSQKVRNRMSRMSMRNKE